MFNEELKVRLTFKEPLLGTLPKNKEIMSEFIASKAPDAKTMEEEIAAIGVEAATEKGMTGFPRNKEGHPILYAYQVRGFFKGALSALTKMPGSESEVITAHKKCVDQFIFIKEREIPIIFDGEITTCQRPLRASTAQGERISLASSEEIKEGAQVEFTIVYPKVISKGKTHIMMRPIIEEALSYGFFNGLGQWRNSGKGSFTWEAI